jgi:hypothetical protein
MKSFTTVPDHHDDTVGTEPITFQHDGRTVTAHPPTVAQYTLFLSAYNALDGGIDQVADIVNFFFALFDGEDWDYFKTRLFDRGDSFGLTGDGGMTDLLNALLPVWTHSVQE